MTEEVARRNRRRSPRVPTRIRILFTRAGTSIAIEAETDDISVDGMFVRTQRRAPDPGTRLGLLLKFEEPSQEMMLSGVVARVREEEETGSESPPPGMGIRFVDMDEGTREALVRALEGTDAYRAMLEAEESS